MRVELGTVEFLLRVVVLDMVPLIRIVGGHGLVFYFIELEVFDVGRAVNRNVTFVYGYAIGWAGDVDLMLLIIINRCDALPCPTGQRSGWIVANRQ